MHLAESVVLAAMKEIQLNTEVQKPSLEEILEFNGLRMECTIEATPHQNAQAYLSACEGGGVMQEFEVGNADEIRTKRAIAKEQLGIEMPLRSAGAYSSPNNPWPRELETEMRDNAFAFAVQKRKVYWKRQGQGNRWDQYGDSSSAASPSASAEEGGKETHIMSEKANQWGPWTSHETGEKYVQPAQPYRLQQANRGEDKWSKWASDVRQSQSENWDYRSFKWRSSAGDDRAWKHKTYDSSEWDGSKWSVPTSRNLSGSGYDTDRDWRAKTMRYGEGWAHDPTYSQHNRAKPTYTDPEDDMKVDPSMPVGSTSKTYNPRTDGQFWKQADSGQEWTQSSASSTQWRPKLRHEKYYSSVAGDTSEASATMLHLGSIDESDGDAVRA